jgi:hypothetical protein
MMRWLNFQCGLNERTLSEVLPRLWYRGWWKQRETTTMRSTNAKCWTRTSHHPIMTCDGRCQWRRVKVNYRWRNIDHYTRCICKFRAVQMSSKHDLLWLFCLNSTHFLLRSFLRAKDPLQHGRSVFHNDTAYSLTHLHCIQHKIPNLISPICDWLQIESNI